MKRLLPRCFFYLLILTGVIYAAVSLRTMYFRQKYVIQLIEFSLTENELKQTYTDQKIVDDIYQMLKDTNEIFTQNDLKYSIISGTLIGAARHKGFIAWDDDADIIVMEEDIEKLHSLKNILNKQGYYFRGCKQQGLCRISKLGNEIYDGELTYPYIDVFIMRKNTEKNLIEFRDEAHRKIWNEWFYEDELFPLKKYKFGPLKLLGPNKYEEHLKRGFGKKVLKEFYIVPRHVRPGHNFKIKKTATPRLLKPTLPSKPLLDRVN